MKQNDLTEEDVAIVKGMLQRGDEQHNIAAWFGINHGRISELKNYSKKWAKKFKSVEPASADGLPHPGPYTSGRNVSDAIRILANLESTTTDTSILQIISELQTLIVQDEASTKENFLRVARNMEKKAAKKKLKEQIKAQLKRLGLDSDSIKKTREQK